MAPVFYAFSRKNVRNLGDYKMKSCIFAKIKFGL